jgi:hypothetical protein
MTNEGTDSSANIFDAKRIVLGETNDAQRDEWRLDETNRESSSARQRTLVEKDSARRRTLGKEKAATTVPMVYFYLQFVTVADLPMERQGRCASFPSEPDRNLRHKLQSFGGFSTRSSFLATFVPAFLHFRRRHS